MIKVRDQIKVDGIDCTIFYIDEEKYWAVDNKTLSKYFDGDFHWSDEYGLFGASGKNIGDGLTNTNLMLASGQAEKNNTIWNYLKQLREIRGNNRWFFCSVQEKEQLRSNLYELDDIWGGTYWLSTEASETEAYIYAKSSSGTEDKFYNSYNCHIVCTFTENELGVSVTISSEDNAEIRYTNDGTDPDETDTLYESPVSASNGDTIKARAYLNDATLPSDITSVTIDTSHITKTESIPLGTELTDGYICYDRGDYYGDYNLSNGVLTRISSGEDDGSYNSGNWRFLVCAKEDLPGNDKDEGCKPVGNGASTNTPTANIGYGPIDTEYYLNAFASNSDLMWYQVHIYRQTHGDKWFVPSLYEGRDSAKNVPNLITGSKYATSYYGGGNHHFYQSNGTSSAVSIYDTTLRCRMFYRI